MIVEALIGGVTVCFVATLRFAKAFAPGAAKAAAIRATFKEQRAVLERRRSDYYNKVQGWGTVVEECDLKLAALAAEERKAQAELDDE